MLLNLLPQHRYDHRMEVAGCRMLQRANWFQLKRLHSTEQSCSHKTQTLALGKVKSITKNPREFRQSVSQTDKQCWATHVCMFLVVSLSLCPSLRLATRLFLLLLLLWPQMPEIYANICIQCPKINRKMVATDRERWPKKDGQRLKERDECRWIKEREGCGPSERDGANEAAGQNGAARF